MWTRPLLSLLLPCKADVVQHEVDMYSRIRSKESYNTKSVKEIIKSPVNRVSFLLNRDATDGSYRKPKPSTNPTALPSTSLELSQVGFNVPELVFSGGRDRDHVKTERSGGSRPHI